MRRFLLTVIIALSASMTIHAQLSSWTKQFLQQRQNDTESSDPVASLNKIETKTMTTDLGLVETVQCFISLKDWSLSELEAEGIVINAKFKNMVLATVPVDKIETLATKSYIKQIDVERRVKMFSDVARVKTYAEDVQTLSSAAQAAGLTQAYDGTGVVLGIIDDGIEFNHTAFKDADGNSRVKAVYLPNASSANGGSTVTIDGSTLLGYQYTTASQIAALTTDDTEASHGTHTTGCAGGTRITTTGLSSNTTYSGMAPGVDLVLCGCGSGLTNTAIASSAKYIANYAKENNKPCVISISLGATIGPHDGTSSLCQVYDDLAEEYGCVILLAAGNEADMQCYISKTLSGSNDYLGTVVAPTSSFSSSYSSSYYAYSYGEIWNSTSDELQVQFVVLNSSGTEKYTSSKMSSGTIAASTLSNYFSSSGHEGISVSGGVDSNNNRYGISFTIDLGRSRSYKLAMLVYGSDGNVITIWNDAYYSQFNSGTSSSYTLTAGDGTCSICDDVTGSKTISVGAYADRLSIPYNYGQSTGTMSNDSYDEQDIAYFSSYGTDFNGVQHPFIAAPGHSVISSVNRYDTESITLNESAYRLSLGSSTYDYWMYMSGTSMATPVAAGVVALYLQADPTLTVDGVKTVISNSAITDDYTNGNNKTKFGAGKINALSGIEYILNQSDPVITVNSSTLSDLTCEAGSTATATIEVTGEYLKDAIAVTLTDENGVFSVSPTSIAIADAEEGATLTVTFSPSAEGTYTGSITLSSTDVESVTLPLSATATKAYPDYYDLTISSVGLSTMYLDFPVEIPYNTYDPDLLGVFVVYQINGTELKLARIDDYIPANTGVIVQGNSGTYRFPKVTGNVAPLEYYNYLSGSVVDITPAEALAAANSNGTIYTLGRGSDSYINFYQYTGSKLSAYKAFLIVEDSNANVLSTGIGGGFTGIQTMDEQQVDGVWYTLQGVQLQKMPTTKGIYIHNGEKIAIK